MLEREEPFSQNDFHPLLVRGLVACLLEAPSTPMEEILFDLPLAEVPQLREFEQLFKSPCELTKKKNPSVGFEPRNLRSVDHVAEGQIGRQNTGATPSIINLLGPGCS